MRALFPLHAFQATFLPRPWNLKDDYGVASAAIPDDGNAGKSRLCRQNGVALSRASCEAPQVMPVPERGGPAKPYPALGLSLNSLDLASGTFHRGLSPTQPVRSESASAAEAARKAAQATRTGSPFPGEFFSEVCLGTHLSDCRQAVLKNVRQGVCNLSTVGCYQHLQGVQDEGATSQGLGRCAYQCLPAGVHQWVAGSELRRTSSQMRDDPPDTQLNSLSRLEGAHPDFDSILQNLGPFGDFLHHSRNPEN